MMIFWGVLIIVFFIVEGLTVGLTSIWFALGSLCALIAAYFGAAIWLQAAVFFVVSLAALAITRPLAVKYVNRATQPTNADMLIGKTVKVTETIDNDASTGTVKVDGKTWSVRTVNGEVVEAGKFVKVESISGVKLMVVPADNK